MGCAIPSRTRSPSLELATGRLRPLRSEQKERPRLLALYHHHSKQEEQEQEQRQGAEAVVLPPAPIPVQRQASSDVETESDAGSEGPQAVQPSLEEIRRMRLARFGG